MAALGIDPELRLVDGGESEIALERVAVMTVTARDRHGLGGAEEIARAGRDDPFFAGQERNLLLSLDGDDPVVDLARQEPQREADDSRRMAAHPLDCEIGLAGVRRAEDRPDRGVIERHFDANVAARRKSASSRF